MSKKLLELAAEIVKGQAGTAGMSPQDIVTSLMRTFNTLQRMQRAEIEGVLVEESSAASVPEVSPDNPPNPKNSILENKVICLECGAEMRQLTANHLGTHKLTPRDYKRKYGLPLKQPLAAKSLTRARSKAAKKRGLPKELREFQERRRLEKETRASSPPSEELKKEKGRRSKKKGAE